MMTTTPLTQAKAIEQHQAEAEAKYQADINRGRQITYQRSSRAVRARFDDDFFQPAPRNATPPAPPAVAPVAVQTHVAEGVDADNPESDAPEHDAEQRPRFRAG